MGGSAGTPLITKNGWTLYEKKLTGGTITITGTGTIDELRLLPANAEMVTYTYDPLIGMTAECNANNQITYYEYDVLNRLKSIRDQDRNILKVYNYKYKEQQ